jgi:glycosyltransferase involved in cell wall biosynthesis
MKFKVFFINSKEKEINWIKVYNLISLLPSEISDCLQRVELADTSCKLDLVSLNEESCLSSFQIEDIQPLTQEESLFFSNFPALIGHAATHLEIWKNIVEEDLDSCIIAESDIDISDLIIFLMSNPDFKENQDLVHLGKSKAPSSCYYLNNLGAKKLLSIQENPLILNLDEYYSGSSCKRSIICRTSKFLELCSGENIPFNYRVRSSHDFYVKDYLNPFDFKLKGIDSELSLDNFEFWKKNLSITACICTYGNYNSCRNSLISLSQQTKSTAEYKILVIDNCPQEKRDQEEFGELQKMCDMIENCTLKAINLVGLSEARNFAIEVCDTDLICYLDDDAIADYRLLQNFCEKFEKFPTIGVCGGKVLPRFQADRPEWLSDDLLKFLSIELSNEENKILTQDCDEIIVGANMCFRLDALKKTGNFKTSLGRNGDILLGGEEDELIQRMNKKYHALYSADCLVEHSISEERLCEDWFIKRSVWQIITNQFVLGSKKIDRNQLMHFLDKRQEVFFGDSTDFSLKDKLSYVQILTLLLIS